MEWSIHHTILSAALASGVVVGYVAARSHFCTMGAVSDWINMGDLGRLRAWFLAIGVAILGVLILELTQGLNLDQGVSPPYRTSDFNPFRHLLGGLLFGVGMTIAGGCGNKTAVRIGGGNLKSVVVLVTIAIVAYGLIWLGGYTLLFEPWLSAATIKLSGTQELSRLLFGDSMAAHLVLGLLIAALILYVVLKDSEFRANRELLTAGIVIGLVVAFVWWLTGSSTTGPQWREYAEFSDTPPSRVATQSLTFIAPMADLLHYLLAPTEFHRLNVGIMVLIGVILGSLAYALLSRSFRIEWFADRNDFINHLVGAVLMAVGGVLGMGCTFGQGITGVSTLAVGSFLTLIGIIAGSAAMMKYLYWKMMQEG
ncbi:MAG: YeeE/YedE family protein [Hydrogenophilus sp.]|nr:YeeE/YedE family protein [Hydrogenophilus sp.]